MIRSVRAGCLVAYARQDEDAEDEIAGEGVGFVSAFDTAGTSWRGSRRATRSTRRGE